MAGEFKVVSESPAFLSFSSCFSNQKGRTTHTLTLTHLHTSFRSTTSFLSAARGNGGSLPSLVHHRSRLPAVPLFAPALRPTSPASFGAVSTHVKGPASPSSSGGTFSRLRGTSAAFSDQIYPLREAADPGELSPMAGLEIDSGRPLGLGAARPFLGSGLTGQTRDPSLYPWPSSPGLGSWLRPA